MGFIDDIKSKKKQKEAENWFNMGIKSQDPEKKLNYFTKSLEINPNNVSAWVKKGKILEEMGKFDEAKNSYERANFLDPSLDIHIKKAGSYKENISITETVSEQEQHSKEEMQHLPENQNISGIFPVETDSDTHREEAISFTPPEGEESLFSNMKKNEASVPEQKNETIEKEKKSLNSIDETTYENIYSEFVEDENNDIGHTGNKLEQDTLVITPHFNEKTEKRTQMDVISVSEENRHTNKILTDVAEKAKTTPEKASIISSYVDFEGKNANLHIPLSETLKFWLVGAIVLLILYLLIHFIGS
jgi:hypothetical protein